MNTFRIPTMEEVEAWCRRHDEKMASRRAVYNARAKARQDKLDSPYYQALERAFVTADRKRLEEEDRRAEERAEKQAKLDVEQPGRKWFHTDASYKAWQTIEAKPERTDHERERERRSRIRWEELIDDTVVIVSQLKWERTTTALRLRETGMTWEAVGKHFNVSKERARQMANHARRVRNGPSGGVSPAERYLNNIGQPELTDAHARDKHRMAMTLEPFAYPSHRDWLHVRSVA